MGLLLPSEELVARSAAGTGEDIATAVAFLLSDDAAYVTGAHLAIHGGLLTRSRSVGEDGPQPLVALDLESS